MDSATLSGMTVAQAAKALGVSRGHIDYLIKAGRIPWAYFGSFRIVTSLAIAPPKRGVGRPRNPPKDPAQL